MRNIGVVGTILGIVIAVLALADQAPIVAILAALSTPIFLLMAFSKEPVKRLERRYCPSCGATTLPASEYQGSSGVSIALLILFFPAFIAYEIWRHCAAKWVCPVCKRAGMIPASSPVARSAGAAPATGLAFDAAPAVSRRSPTEFRDVPDLSRFDGPIRFKIEGVDRSTKLETTWYCEARTEANARAKAELEGIVVTAVSVDDPIEA